MSVWTECFVSIRFDLDVGPVVEHVTPADALGEDGKVSVIQSAFPDCNPDCGHDFIFFFTMRDCTRAAQVGLSATVATPTTSSTLPKIYGATYYRQKRDPRVTRGYVQQVIVLLSRIPYLAVHELILRVVAPRFCQCCHLSPDTEKVPVASALTPIPATYFEVDSSYNPDHYTQSQVLDEAVAEMTKWPSPHPRVRYEVTLLHQALEFVTPAHPFRPQLRAVRRPAMVLDQRVELLDKSHSSWGRSLQEYLPLCSILGTQLRYLTRLWELVISHEALFIISNTPCTAAAAAFCIASLVAPVDYSGHMWTYLTVQNEDFSRLSRMGKALPFPEGDAIIVAGTNPFLVRSFDGWKNVFGLLDRNTRESSSSGSVFTRAANAPGQRGKGSTKMSSSLHQKGSSGFEGARSSGTGGVGLLAAASESAGSPTVVSIARSLTSSALRTRMGERISSAVFATSHISNASGGGEGMHCRTESEGHSHSRISASARAGPLSPRTPAVSLPYGSSFVHQGGHVMSSVNSSSNSASANGSATHVPQVLVPVITTTASGMQGIGYDAPVHTQAMPVTTICVDTGTLHPGAVTGGTGGNADWDGAAPLPLLLHTQTTDLVAMSGIDSGTSTTPTEEQFLRHRSCSSIVFGQDYPMTGSGAAAVAGAGATPTVHVDVVSAPSGSSNAMVHNVISAVDVDSMLMTNTYDMHSSSSSSASSPAAVPLNGEENVHHKGERGGLPRADSSYWKAGWTGATSWFNSSNTITVSASAGATVGTSGGEDGGDPSSPLFTQGTFKKLLRDSEVEQDGVPAEGSNRGRKLLQHRVHNYFASPFPFLLNHHEQTAMLMRRLEAISHMGEQAQRDSMSQHALDWCGSGTAAASGRMKQSYAGTNSNSGPASSRRDGDGANGGGRANGGGQEDAASVASTGIFSQFSVADDIVRKFFTSLTKEFLLPVTAWFAFTTQTLSSFHLCDVSTAEVVLSSDAFLVFFQHKHRDVAPPMLKQQHSYKTYKTIYERFARGTLFHAYVRQMIEERLRRDLEDFDLDTWITSYPAEAGRIDMFISLLKVMQRELGQMIDPDIVFVSMGKSVLATMTIAISEPLREQFMQKVAELKL